MTEPKTTELETIKINTKEGKLLSDLVSLESDLEFTKATLKLLSQRPAETKSDNEINTVNIELSENVVINRALYTSALISYTRCFNKGARLGLTSEIFNYFKDSEGAKKAHKHFTDLRSKHFAHSINPFEQHQTIGLLKENHVVSVANINIFLLNHTNQETFLNLVEASLLYVKREIELKTKLVLEEAQKMSMEEIEKAKKTSMKIAGLEQVNEFRK
ncbi:hypothetical protein [Flavobacterium sangjuense]|uniref:Uncharacterized protein n=1 Tax=Flavobacterium sangjuense TaxID=2518177 RepID=A0A4P7PRR2_9FLAO|nr:hypothetical protein [Flavobacterium sangjuense]QBZ97568.1 hypothetical protein GS03_01060 [Flavobacterium sangjuense]